DRRGAGGPRSARDERARARPGRARRPHRLDLVPALRGVVRAAPLGRQELDRRRGARERARRRRRQSPREAVPGAHALAGRERASLALARWAAGRAALLPRGRLARSFAQRLALLDRWV